jgi:hypothetical protein
MSDVYQIHGETYKIAPTSCTCGGTHAWLRLRDTGAWEMIGCVCHHTLIPGPASITIVRSPETDNLILESRDPQGYTRGVALHALDDIYGWVNTIERMIGDLL